MHGATTSTRARRAICAAAGVLLLAGTATAQPAREARARFDRGLELFEEERYDAALAEFLRAYEIAPSWQVLFNIARAHAFLGRAVEAVRWYERFLEEGGARIPADMRARAQEDLARQRARIGRLDVRCDLDGAVVSVDGVDVATTPLPAPIEVSAGDHVVAVRAPGYDQSSQAVQVAGGTDRVVEFTLRAVARGVLRIRSPLPGVEVRVGDRVVGTTPLSSTVPVPPGAHVVVGARPGYRETRVDAIVEMGAEREIVLRPEVDPDAAGTSARLVLRIPDAPARARVDGDERDPRRPIELPFGPHAVELEVEAREPWRGTPELTAGAELVLRIDLRWTEEARRARLEGAGAQRSIGFILAGAGTAVALGAAIALGWSETRTEATVAERDMLAWCFRLTESRAAPQRDVLCPGWGARVAANDASLSEIEVLRGVFGATVAATGVTAAIGLVLALLAPSEADVDRAASAELRVGPGALDLRVAF